DKQAPQSVANYFDYILNNRYDGTIFHRMDNSLGVLQGGGFGLQSANSTFTFPAVATSSDPGVTREYSDSIPTAIGTLALARTSDPNSGTSEFFFNFHDNTTNLGSGNGGGYAVFGKVATDPLSQKISQLMQATPTFTESQPTTFPIPLQGYT